MGGSSSREALNISGSREILMMGTSSNREEEVQERLSSPPNKEGEQRNGDQEDWLMASSREQLCQTGSNSTDSGIQSVGEVQSPEEDSESPGAAVEVEALSLVHRMWGGRMETSYTCLTCSSTSSTLGWFTDPHLAIPSSTSSPEASTSKDTAPSTSTP